MRRLAILALILLLAAAACRQAPPADEHLAQGVAPAGEPIPVVWETSWDAALERAHNERKPLVVVFHADWSAWSVHMSGSVFCDPSVEQTLTERAVPLRVEVDEDGGEEARQHGVEHLPTVLVLSADGAELERLVGVCRAEDIVDAIGRAATAGEP